jgi:hypothetical protein
VEASERALLEKTVRDALEGAASGADGVLAQLGWGEMLTAEPRVAVEVVCTALGATNANATVLDDVLAVALGLEPSPDRAVLLPPFGSWGPPGPDGLATGRAGAGATLVVVSEGGRSLAEVEAGAVATTPVRGIDPDAGWCLARVDAAASSTTPLDPGAWDGAVAAGRRALAHQISGACRTMLALARDHALERVQFGRPVVRFQAVRHRLAEALVAVEALDATLAAAWDEPGPTTAALAKASAGRAARTVATHCQQVLAGMGFTTDHPFHRSLKRTLTLEGILGAADDIVTALGHTLIADRTAPTLVDL